MTHIKIISALFLFFMLGISKPAYAYLDPGSGSYILQLLIAGGMAAAFTLKTFWKRLSLSLKARLAAFKNTRKPEK